MERERLVRFIASIMEDSGFKVYTDYKINNHTIDIYGVLKTSVGEVGVVVACKNYEEPWKIGLDILKEMEMVAKSVHASKIVIFTTSSYSHQAAVYAQKRNIKLVDRKGLIKIAKSYAKKRTIVSDDDPEEDYDYEDYEDYDYGSSTTRVSLDKHESKYKKPQNPFTNKLNPFNNNGFTKSTNHYSINTATKKSKRSASDVLDYFKKHTILTLIVTILIATVVTYILGHVLGKGPFTGLAKIITAAILSYGIVSIIDQNISNIITLGSVSFFVSMIIYVLTLTL
ncbi:MAG: restriction endonuclease [Methanobacteriaceae archaeon]|nr:restriction endonuclease [Methanobacteriaceae archaeon]